MGEGVGDHTALGAALDGVVADGGGRAQAILQVALLQRNLSTRHRRGAGGPDAGVTVGLQFDADLAAVSALRAGAGLAQRSSQVLDVVADLVGDDIGAGELTLGAEPAL